jgi:hypothetical protein
MTDKNAASHNPRAIKFQRLLFGILLLVAFVFNWLPPVILVAALMLLFTFVPMKYSPFYRLYLVLSRETEDGCLCSKGETSFTCGVGGAVLSLAVYLDFTGVNTVAWILTVLVAGMLLLAGTTGFCLGSLVYAWLERKF